MFKGINQDIHPKYSKESYNYALNANLENLDTNYPYLNSDFGNLECVKLPGKILGHCIDKDNNFIIITNENKIYRLIDCKLEELSKGKDYSCLNLQNSEYLELVYTVLRGCEELVYFTDGINKYRVINISNMPNSCDEMNYSPDVSIPNITYSLSTGGEVYAGNYFYTIRYIDRYGTPTNWFVFSDPISVYSYSKNTFLNGESIVKTDKSIIFNVGNLDKKYPSYQIGVIEYSSFSRAITKVFMLPENTNIYTGNNEIQITSVNDLLVNRLVVEVVGTHTKHLNRLFIGNLQFTEYDWANVQKLANKVKLIYTVSKHPKDLPVKTFRHNDVYDFGIVGVFSNTRTTPVFHIPGRGLDPNLSEYDLLNINHLTKNISNNIDTGLVNNDLNLSVCRDCQSIVLKYTGKARLNGPNLDFEFDYMLPYTDANVKLVVSLGTTEYSYDIKGNGKVATAFPYSGSQIINIKFIVERKDCSWQGTTSLFYNDLIEEDELLLSPISVTLSKIPRWRIINTALRHKIPYKKFIHSGLMGYYESCERYPDVRDCDNKPIYPHSEEIDPITGEVAYVMDYVRYHRMPDAMLEPWQDKDFVYSLNYNIDLKSFIKELISIDPKFKEVTQWKIVYAERNNPLVKDTGLIYSCVQAKDKKNDIQIVTLGVGENDLLGYMPEENLFKSPSISGGTWYREPKYFTYISPNTLYKDILEGEYMYIINQFSNSEWDNKFIKNIAKTPSSPANNVLASDTYWYHSNFYTNLWKPGNAYYNKVVNSRLVSPVKHITDDDGSEYLGVSSTLGNRTVRNMLYSNNLGFLEFESHPGNNTYLIDLVSNGQPYTFQKSIYHYNKEGDAWLSKFVFTLSQPGFIYKSNWQNYLSLGLNDINAWINDGLGANIDRRTNHRAMVDMWIESDINTQYRFKGTNSWESFYEGSQGLNTTLQNKVISVLENDKKKIGGTTEEDILYEYFPEYNKINLDYSLIYSPSTNFKLPIIYDYCSKCTGDYPNRIYYSEGTYLENSKDNMREIRVNNYQDLDNEVNTLFKDKDELYARTPKHIYKLFTRESKIKADNTNIFLGTNEILSIPAQRTASTEYTYGGSSHKIDIINTEYGTFYVSDNHIVQLSDKLDILEEGLRGFLKNNLRSEYPDQVKYRLNYDYRFNRIFISKIDYKPLYRNIIYKDSKWYQEVNNKLLYIPNQVENKEMFENKSFTLSYSLLNKSFISFHSWIPDYTFFNNLDYYTHKNNIIYKHNTENYLEYYQKDYSMVVDIPLVKNTETANAVWTNLLYTQLLDNVNTFKGYIAYNEVQSTGYQELISKTSIFNPHNLTKVENIFNISLEKNLVNIPLFSNDWVNIKDEYPIDKVSLPFNIQGAFNKEDLRSQFINLRLFYDNKKKIFKDKLSFDIVTTLQLNSLR